MKKHSVQTGIIALLIGLINCSNEPDIIITSPPQMATVYGEIIPSKPPARVSIIRDKDTIATAYSDTNSGTFIFRNIPFNMYTLYASNGKAARTTQLRVEQPVIYGNEVHLTGTKEFIAQMTFDDGDTIYPDSGLGDSLVSMGFYMDYASDYFFADTAIRTNPISLRSRFSCIKSNNNKSLELRAPKAALFAAGHITLTLYASNINSSNSLPSDSVSLTYVIDTTHQRRIITRMLLIDESLNSSYGTIAREENAKIRFARPMNHDSVEKSIIVTPPFTRSYSWADNILTILQANALAPRTTYTITIDTHAMTTDSIHFGSPFEYSFTTGDKDLFTSTWPLDSGINIPVNVPFQFNSSYSIEPELIQSSFSISPQIDSLLFYMDKTGIVKVSHAPLMPGMAYHITIDKSCQSRMGVILGKDLTISFTTAPAN